MSEEPKTPETPVEPDKLDTVLEALSTMSATYEEKLSAMQEEIASLRQPAEPVAPANQNPEGWIPKSWDEIPKVVEERAAEATRRVIEENDKARAEAEEMRRTAVKEFDQEIDEQVAKLEKEGKLVPIANQDDPNDPGRIQRRQLFGLASNMGTTQLDQVADTLHIAWNSGQEYDWKSKSFVQSRTKPAGFDAPVTSSSARTGSGRPVLTYKDIHNAKMDQLTKLIDRF